MPILQLPGKACVVSPGILWHPSASLSISWHILALLCISLHISASLSISRYLVATRGILRHLMASHGISWHLLGPRGISRHLRASRCISWYLLYHRRKTLSPLCLRSCHFVRCAVVMPLPCASSLFYQLPWLWSCSILLSKTWALNHARLQIT